MTTQSLPVGSILNIGGSELTQTLRASLQEDFLLENTTSESKTTTRALPTELFYTSPSIPLLQSIHNLPDNHQPRDELALLETHGREIAAQIPKDCTILDLASGTSPAALTLLSHLNTLKTKVSYYALDINRETLESSIRTLSAKKYKHIRHHGPWGTLEDGKEWLSNHALTVSPCVPKCILGLDSLFGRYSPDLLVEELRSWRALLVPSTTDSIFLTLDARSTPSSLRRTYHDQTHTWENFIRQGLVASNALLGARWYRPEDWVLGGVVDVEGQESASAAFVPAARHVFTVSAVRNVECKRLGMRIRKGEVIACCEEWKYGVERVEGMVQEAGMVQKGKWQAPGGGSLGVFDAG
ncbi:hypothetical protein BJY04DRAFT_215908 [Aspergillus karnatakaensis]|uniref:uncharacterized protein n=1 Tax=Aspergillus karnatakaensis TaxID=1810916 RepID=UPI003CCD95D4